MKTLLLAIASSIGIGLGIAALMIFGNISPALPPSHDWNSRTLIGTPGLNNTYQVGDTAKFSIFIHGFTNRCATPAIMLYEDSQPDRPILNYPISLMSCPINDTLPYTLYLPSKSDNFSATFERPGHYTLDILFDKDESIQTHFLVTGPKITSIYDTGITSHRIQDVFENNCGQFYTLPQDNHTNGSETYPVLILKQNSISCAKITFKIDSKYNEGGFALNPWPQMLNFTDVLHVGKYHYISSGNSYGVSSIDATTMFKIKSIPEMVDLAKYPTGSRFTVTLVIKPLSNATGFYDYSIDEIPCNSYPLAVGYSPDQVNSSDFSKGMIGMHNHSCIAMPFEISLVQVSGMDFKLVKFS